MANDNKKSAWKAIYVGILVIVTLACVGVGITIHVLGRFSNNGDIVEKTYIPEGKIDSIKVDVNVTDLEVVYGEAYLVTYKYPEKINPTFDVKDGTFSITEKSKKESISFSFGLKGDDYKMIIQIPYETKLEDVNITANLGSIELNDIYTKSLEVKADCGSVELTDVQADKLDVKAELGSVECDKLVSEDATIKAECGSIEVDNSTIKNSDIKAELGSVEMDGTFDKLKIKCELGSIDVTSDKGTDDMELDLDAELGSVTVNGKEWK